MSAPVLELESVTHRFRAPGRRSGTIVALDGVDLRVDEREAVGLVGASGAGKSTVARLAVGLLRPDDGQVRICGQDAYGIPRRERAQLVHLVFQDPYSSLPPHVSVERIVAEPLEAGGLGASRSAVAEALEEVGLVPVASFLRRRSTELSGGQRQRVALARALVLRPRLLIADEPTQMLDPTARLELLALVAQLRTRRAMAVLHVTHDLALANQTCERLVVLDHGRVVESGPAADVLASPTSDQAQRLVDASRRMTAAFTGMSRPSAG